LQLALGWDCIFASPSLPLRFSNWHLWDSQPHLQEDPRSITSETSCPEWLGRSWLFVSWCSRHQRASWVIPNRQ